VTGLEQGAEVFPDWPADPSAFDDRRGRFLETREVKKLYVGNLPFSATEESVTELFEKHGAVHSVALISDRDTGRPRGFGFIEMDDDGAQAAMGALNGYEMDGRELNVNEAQDRPRRGGGGGGYGGGRGGGGGGRRERW
jgi:RNA recognition motif-containing protein